MINQQINKIIRFSPSFRSFSSSFDGPFISSFLQYLNSRELVNQCTNYEELDKKLCEKGCVGYLGFDATAPQLHLGHLPSMLMIRRFQREGHQPILLIGGATTQIGDPTGKNEMRKMISKDSIIENSSGLIKTFQEILHSQNNRSDEVINQHIRNPIMVNNIDWWLDMSFLEVLGEIGSKLSVHRLLSLETMKNRMENSLPLSFLEFSYPLLQATDFYRLWKEFGCDIQFGGADQWGNIVTGVELIRKMQVSENNQISKSDQPLQPSSSSVQSTQSQVFGLTYPLLTTSSGRKMGKSEDGAIWLIPPNVLLDDSDEKISVRSFELWQYFRNVNDSDIVKCFRWFTELSNQYIKEEIKLRLDGLMNSEDPGKGSKINEMKIVLANEVTQFIFGKEILDSISNTSLNLFHSSSNSIPSLYETSINSIPTIQLRFQLIMKEEDESIEKKEKEEEEGKVSSSNISDQSPSLLISKLLVQSGLFPSNSKARKVMKEEGAIKINGKKILQSSNNKTKKFLERSDFIFPSSSSLYSQNNNDDDHKNHPFCVISFGKKKFVKIELVK